MLTQPITSNYKLSHRIGKRKRARGGYSRFPISNIDSRPAAAAADSDDGEGDAAAAVCAARQDSERNSRLRQKSWEPNSFRCCRTHAEARGKEGRREAACTCSRHRARSCRRPSPLRMRARFETGGRLGAFRVGDALTSQCSTQLRDYQSISEKLCGFSSWVLH